MLIFSPVRRIATLRSGTFGDGESAEADEANIITLLQGIDDRIKDGVHRLAGVGLRKVGHFGHMGNEVVLVHLSPPWWTLA